MHRDPSQRGIGRGRSYLYLILLILILNLSRNEIFIEPWYDIHEIFKNNITSIFEPHEIIVFAFDRKIHFRNF